MTRAGVQHYCPSIWEGSVLEVSPCWCPLLLGFCCRHYFDPSHIHTRHLPPPTRGTQALVIQFGFIRLTHRNIHACSKGMAQIPSAFAANLVIGANQIARVRLLASQQKESGVWLSAPPVSALGLRMDDNSIQIAMGLHLGSALCLPHDCAQCGTRVDETGIHDLSCQRSQGRFPRHTCLNDIMKHALVGSRHLLHPGALWPP